MLKDFMNELSKELKSEEPLAPNEQQAYSLQLNVDWNIEISEIPLKGINLFSKLTECPNQKVEDFLLKVMEANLFGKETGGNYLGLDKEGKHITFSGFIPESMKYNEFRELLEDFINYAEVWREDAIKLRNTANEENSK